MSKSVLMQFFVLLSLLSAASAKIDFNLHLEDKVVDLTSPKIIKWSNITQLIRNAVFSVVNPNLQGASVLLKRLTVSSSCRESLFFWVREIANARGWAHEMFDATGKIPGGILEGTVMGFGSMEQCLKVKVRNDGRDKKELFRGRFCMVGFKPELFSPLSSDFPDGKNYTDTYGQPPEWANDILINAAGYLKNIAFWIGACIPSTCSEEDVFKISKLIAIPFGMNATVKDCHVDEPYVWPSYSIAAVSVLGCLVGICGIGTFVDIIQKYQRNGQEISKEEHVLLRVTKAFSLLTNTEKLFSTPSGGCLGCFHGIRFLSATWIVLGHTYFYTDTWKYLKYRRLMGFQQQFNGYLPVAVLDNFTIPVGSFFFMSGLLLVYTTWKKLEKNGGKLNIFMFIVHKFWRMTPALGLTIILLLALPLVDSGPIWNSTLNPQIQRCRDLWWTNLLYISNWWSVDQNCLIHTWYLSALMQFHILGVIILVVTARRPVIGVVFGSLIMAGCVTVTCLIVAWNNFPMPSPGLTKDMDVIDDYNSQVYSKPFYHFPTYVIGMIVGYIILKQNGRQLPLKYQILGWTLAVASALSSVYGLYGKADHIAVRILYIIGFRLGWAAGIGWMTYACATGMGGIINRFLSWKGMAPLGQLSFLTYLFHPLVIIYRNAALKERVYYGHTELVFAFLSTLVFSMFIAYAGYVALEMPFGILEKIVFGSRSKVNLKDAKCKDVSPVCTRGIKNIDP